MIFIALGANLESKYGQPEETLAAACREIEARGIKILQSSRIWLTAPVPVSDQPWYYNAVVQVQTELSPASLLAVLQQIEAGFGRVRTVKDAARVLDLDILTYNDVVVKGGEQLIIPHPRMQERAFVLLPLKDIVKTDENWVHPVSKQGVVTLICGLPCDQEAKTLSENPLFDVTGDENEAV